MGSTIRDCRIISLQAEIVQPLRAGARLHWIFQAGPFLRQGCPGLCCGGWFGRLTPGLQAMGAAPDGFPHSAGPDAVLGLVPQTETTTVG